MPHKRVLPHTIIGYRKSGAPIYEIAGGAGDDDGDDTTDVDMGDDDITDTDDDGGDTGPGDGDGDAGKPTAKKDNTKAGPDPELARVRAALAKERAARRDLDKQVKALKTANEGDTEKQLREAREAAQAAAESRYKPALIATAAAAEFLAAGLAVDADRKNSVLTQLSKLIDSDAVTITDDGAVDGVEDEVARIKADFPDLFRKPTPAARNNTGSVDGGRRTPTPAKEPKTSAERIAAMYHGGRR